MNYDVTVIGNLIASGQPGKAWTSDHALLEWDAEAHTLTATRINRGLRLLGNEKGQIQRNIYAAGYQYRGETTIRYSIDTIGNERVGIRWTIVGARQKAQRATQEGLL